MSKRRWTEVWARLETEGWTIERGPRGKTFQTYYMPPGVKRGPGKKNRVDYFDSKTLVLRHIEALSPSIGTEEPRQDAQDESSLSPALDTVPVASIKDDSEDTLVDDRTVHGKGAQVLPIADAEPLEKCTSNSLEAAQVQELQPRIELQLQLSPQQPQPQQHARQASASQLGDAVAGGSIVPCTADTTCERMFAEVRALKASIDIATAQTPDSIVISTLDRLASLGSLSVNVFRETHIGKAVSALLKRTQSCEVQGRARNLLTAWKGSVLGSSAKQERATAARVDRVPSGVDPKVWHHIPADCRIWAIAPDAQAARQEWRQQVLAKHQECRLQQPMRAEERVAHSKVPTAKAIPANVPPAALPGDPPPQDRCLICMATAKSHAFVPCGHHCACEACSAAILYRGQATCPVCRARVRMAMRIFS